MVSISRPEVTEITLAEVKVDGVEVWLQNTAGGFIRKLTPAEAREVAGALCDAAAMAEEVHRKAVGS